MNSPNFSSTKDAREGSQSNQRGASSTYREGAQSISDLVLPDRVHADVYINPEVFALEQERLFAHTWQYVGHGSQIPNAGDFYTTTIADQPLAMIRQADGSIRVLINRCAHKGTAVLSGSCGNAGKVMRCPYHAWTYRLDGSLLSIPLRAEYEHTSFSACDSAAGLTRITSVDHKGFVFARLAPEGIDFETYAGEMIRVLDNLVDRAPGGEVSVSGGCIRSVVPCNWKVYLENVNDAVHAISTHESVVSSAESAWGAQGDKSSKPVAVEQLLPFGLGLDFVRTMGAQVMGNGHSILGTKASLHTNYASLAKYEALLTQVHGQQKTSEILAFAPQNAVLYPSLALKCSPQLLRVVRPLSVDKTLIEAWTLNLKGAPEELLQRTLGYSRLVYSPMSPVAHDDIHVFESIQRSLAARSNPWISLHRLHRADEAGQSDGHSATSEILMRNQFRAWAHWMTPGSPAPEKG